MEYITLNNGIRMPQEGFGVFQVRDKEECKRLIAAMCADGRLTRVQNRFCLDSAFLRQTVDWIRGKIEADGSLTLAELRDHLNTSRKYALMILEYCDNAKTTEGCFTKILYNSITLFYLFDKSADGIIKDTDSEQSVDDCGRAQKMCTEGVSCLPRPGRRR